MRGSAPKDKIREGEKLVLGNMRSGMKGILYCQSIICQLVINLNCFIYQGSLDISCFLYGNMVQRFQTEYCFMLIMIKLSVALIKPAYRLFIQTNECYWLLDAETRSWCLPMVQLVTRNQFSLGKQECYSSKGFWMMIPFPVFSPGTCEKVQWQREHHMLAKHISYQSDLLGWACSERTVGSCCNQPSNSSGPMGCSLSTGLLLLCLPTSVSMLVISLL